MKVALEPRLKNEAGAGRPGLSAGGGRVIRCLRLSVTDRCNLRCRYCRPEGWTASGRPGGRLTGAEIVRLAGVFLGLGVTKIRLTGGEPLVRPDLPLLVRRLKESGADDLRLTTNGLFLERMAESLLKAGLSRINISLDSLRPDRYRAITGGGDLDRVLAGIDCALSAGFAPVRLNVVVIRGFNDDEIEDLARLSVNRPLQVRFIEFMPVGDNGWTPEAFVPRDEIMRRLEKLGGLTEISRKLGDGPAKRYRLAGALGEVGLIAALSDHFCAECDRLRLTSDGLLLNCLFAYEETDLKTMLRAGADDEELAEAIRLAAAAKPTGHHQARLNQSRRPRPMTAVGG